MGGFAGRESHAAAGGRDLLRPLRVEVRTNGGQDGKGCQGSGGKVLAKRKPMLLSRSSGAP
jgi:hypothetical protein